MSDRLSRQRWWIACLYGLAVVLAQGFHTHHAPSMVGGRTTLDAPAPCGDHAASVDDVRADGPAFTSCSNDCPSCEFTLNHQAATTAPVQATEAVRVAHDGSSTSAEPDTSPARPRTRAPPTLA